MTHEPEPEPERQGPGPELSDAVEDALRPATHDAVMAVWQRVVLGRLDRGQPVGEEEEILRRLYEGERPERPEQSERSEDPPPDQ
ncbi:hypothetical protein GCM10023201_59270 [Actinomycetospora corticicola]|uniref:Uncharacterized protein n=1 Tax=Actinomycetospora corticicola TaxID=663602 RepID=A0A7Y9E202_9PSEU|nr:hypothetical protein [Actinomycetospora corticicola]NYD39708.1 hypothetical protein [Actinomycetospora corticicola]